jgi:16S rRNA (uracil1498-N3)-methyltransferase
MVERRTRTMIRLFVEGFERGRVDVTGDALQHARVRRVERGEPIELLDGAGRVASGRVDEPGKKSMTVVIDHVDIRTRPAELEVIVPVADRDRMLLAAEKCVELQITAWRPVYFARSRSVTPRGDGPKFREKVRARMQAALEQSGGAWLPTIAEEADFADAVRATRPGLRHLLLDARGEPISRQLSGTGGTVLMVGPEGGIEEEERQAALRERFIAVALSSATLRFETAIIAGVAVVRANQLLED